MPNPRLNTGAAAPFEDDPPPSPSTMNDAPDISEADSNQSPPLPLVPFEHYMLLEDVPDYPMVFVFRLIFRGSMNQAAMTCAIYEATRRHPLLHSLLVTSEKGTLAWQEVDRNPDIVWLEDSSSLADQLWTQVNLKQEIGLKIFVDLREDLSHMYFRVHHACCDGMGAYAYFEDILACYEAFDQIPHAIPELKKIDPSLLAGRGDFGAPPTPPPTTHQWRDFFGGAKEAIKFLSQPPQSLAPDLESKDPATPSPEAGFLTHTLPEEMLPALRRKAEEAGASLNDLLLRDLFLTLRQWNEQHKLGSAKSRFQIMMPTGLRGAGDKEMSAANMIGYAFLMRDAASFDQPQELLSGLATETTAIIRYRYPLIFIGAITFLLKWPWGLRRLLRIRRCFGTVVLTNLGDPTRRFVRRFTRKKGLIHVGSLVLEEITGIPPFRPLTGAVFSAITYGGKLQIGIRCDPLHFSPAATRSLLKLFIDQLQHSAE